MIVKGITIHNTNNSLSARENFDMLYHEHQEKLCHYLIDECSVVRSWPESKEASHTGKGYDFGNQYTLAIEICRSTCDLELYLKAQDNAVKFIKQLMEKYGLSTEDLYFHRDFDTSVGCPHRILELYRTKGEFINGCFI